MNFKQHKITITKIICDVKIVANGIKNAFYFLQMKHQMYNKGEVDSKNTQ